MERIPTVPAESQTNEEYRAVLDVVQEGLLDIPVDASEEELERYRVAIRDALPLLESLIGHAELGSEAPRDLAFIALAFPREGVTLPGITDLDYENGAQARRILFAHKEALLKEALEEKKHPHWTHIIQLESVPGYDEEIGAYLREEVQSLGLDLSELEEAWKQAGEEERYKEYKTYNLFQLLRLEKKVPGSGMELFRRFGIADFARYPIEVLEAQYRERENVESPYGIMLYPRSDWNGAFYHEEDLIRNFSESLEGSHQLRIIECESKWEIAKQLLSLQQAYEQKEEGHKISFVVLCGHGNNEVIDFGGKEKRHRLHISDLTGEGISRTGSFFEEDATVIIFSCTTGMEGGIGQELSRALQATVIAPIDATSPESVIYENGAFHVTYKNDVPANSFHKGTLVQEGNK